MGGYGSSKIRATRRRRIYRMNFSTKSMEDNEICDFYLVDTGEKTNREACRGNGSGKEYRRKFR